MLIDNNPLEIIKGMMVYLRNIIILEEIIILRMNIYIIISHIKSRQIFLLLMAFMTPNDYMIG